VTPANVYMLQRSDLFPQIAYWLLVVRLPLQVGLLLLIAWSCIKSEGSSRGSNKGPLTAGP
jgi:uncharacterized membrane protein